jgi:isopentenyl-diphosphate delta-isomerase
MASNPNDNKGRIVSSEDEALILVDEDDQEIGFRNKADCHDGDGVLHRAFSIFLFDADGRLLLQKRAAGKRLWPLYWSNTCCSHPRRGETLEIATRRRLEDELHTSSVLDHVYRFTYHAQFGALGSERELCHVFLGRVDGEPVANPTEIAEVRYVAAEDLDRELAADPGAFTPWLKLEWQRLRGEYGSVLDQYLATA